MSFDDLARALHLTPVHDVWRTGFAESVAAMPLAERWWIRDETAFVDTCRRAGLSEELIETLLPATRQLLGHEPLRRLVWHVYRHIFELGLHDEHELGHWPMLPEPAGDLGRLLYAFVYLLALPRALAFHEQRQIPPSITRATLADIELWMREYRERTGRWGLDQPWWPSTYFTGQLYALGRLQFEMNRFALPFRVFRHREDGQVVALIEPGQRMGSHGQFADAFGGRDAGETWTSTLTETDASITGHLVTPRGEVHRDRTITLDRSDWSEVLRRDDPALAVHIPATGPLTPEACDDAFAHAKAFFPRHFPEHAATAYWTCSWMLDPQLADHLPPGANLVRFLHRFHLVPIPGADDSQIRERVFGADKDQPVDQLPQSTSLQRTIVHHMRAGGQWRMTGGVILEQQSPSRPFT